MNQYVGEPVMTVVEELIAQRDAVLFGTWVQRSPHHPNEACLVQRNGAEIGKCSCGCGHPQIDSEQLSAKAVMVVECVLRRKGWITLLRAAHGWNDHEATYEQVLDVLDEAIRDAKEAG